MPLQSRVSRIDRLVICVSEGIVTLEDFRRCLADLEKAGALSYAKIFDATHGTSGLSDADRAALAALLGERHKASGLGPFAIVAGSDRNTGLAQLFRTLATVARPMRLFADIHAARKWLNTRSRIRP